MKTLIIILASALVMVSPSFGEMPGDVNNDGKVGLEDIICGLQIVAGIRPQQSSITVSLGASMTFVLIPAGTFMMGSPTTELGRSREETQHQVTLTKSFYMQTTEVTQGQWKAVMGSNTSFFSSCGDDCPVEIVSWDDATSFIQKLNQMEGTTQYRLPTEAEWEYAAKAGSTTAFHNGEITHTS
jgi:formylglycine-generating enzyme required for sulfatase activity